MMTITKITRRGFLKGTAGIAGTGLVLGFNLPSTDLFASEIGSFAPNLFISIEKTGKIHLIIPHQEMGQGTGTALMQLLADELEASWDDLVHENAIGHPKYGAQNTDGSFSVKIRFTPFREAGAAAKEMLIAAAAKKWNVPVAELTAKDSHVIHTKTSKKEHYSELVDIANTLPVPEKPKLKDPKDFKFIGKDVLANHTPDVVTGTAVYGMDVEVPGMVHASLERSPTLTGTIKSYDKKKAMAVKGVLDVVEIQGIGLLTNNAIAVVATNTWSAIQGRQALNAQWDTGTEPLESDVPHRKQLEELTEQSGNVIRSEGDFEATRSKADKTVTARYYSPNLVHAPMSPMVATVSVKGDTAEVWAPTQHPQWAASAVGGFLGHQPEQAFGKVTIHPTLIGGAFGRKSKPDCILEATAVSKAIGKPVKVTWKREDEIQHGFYRAASAQKLEATLDKEGYPLGWKHTTVFPTILKTFVPNAVDPVPLELGQGFSEMPYRIENVQMEAKGAKSDARVGWLRSVAHIHHAWAMNNFVDEMAEAAGVDPVEYRLKLLGAPREVQYKDMEKFLLPHGNQPFKTGRLAGVIELAAKEAGWGRKMPKGRALGFAAHKSFNSYIAMVAEASIEGGNPRIHKVHAAVDIGQYVNPLNVKAQVEGAFIFGLSAALYGEITLKDGVVQQSNFHDYRMVRINEAPEVEVMLVESKEMPTGIGEPGVPPVTPAVTSALYNLTGKRIYELPLSKHSFA